jgi:hypothetical protein
LAAAEHYDFTLPSGRLNKAKIARHFHWSGLRTENALRQLTWKLKIAAGCYRGKC